MEFARRRPLRFALLAVLATLLAASLVYVVVDGRRARRTRSVAFGASEPTSLTVEPLADDSGALVETIAAPFAPPIPLPKGTYRLRSTGVGRLGESFEFTVGDEPVGMTLDGRGTRFCEPLAARHLPAIVDLGRERGLVLFDERNATLCAGRTDGDDSLGRRWRASLPVPFVPPFLGNADDDGNLPTRGQAAWTWRPFQVSIDLEPHVVPNFVDLDGDHVGDVVCTARHRPTMWAMSGATGRTLWSVDRGAAMEEEGVELFLGGVPDAPVVVRDADGDGVDDLLVRFRWWSTRPADGKDGETVELVSGRDGRTRWAYSPPVDANPPNASPLAAATTRFVAGSSSVDALPMRTYPPCVIDWGEERRVAVSTTRGVQGLELATGRAAESFVEFPEPTIEPPQWLDLDGDGRDDVVTLADDPRGFTPPRRTRFAFSPALRRVLWKSHAAPFSRDVAPWLVDLDGDGRAEAVTVEAPPAGSALAAVDFEKHFGLACRDGATGETRWCVRAPRGTSDFTFNEFSLAGLVGPDLDGDGCRDVVLAWPAGVEMNVRVEAFSGRTGTTLWRQAAACRRLTPEYRGSYHVDLRWWRAAGEGSPIILLDVNAKDVDPPDRHVAALSASTGRVLLQGRDAARFAASDLDGDGVEELLTFYERPDRTVGEVHVRQGTADVRRVALSIAGLPDLDGDGVRETMVASDDFTQVVVYDGATNAERFRFLQRHEWIGGVEIERPPLRVAARPEAPASWWFGDEESSECEFARVDFDRDGFADFIIEEEGPTSWVGGATMTSLELRAISGRQGSTLWRTRDHQSAFAVGVVDLEADGELETWGLWPTADQPPRLVLSVLSARTGAPRWSRTLPDGEASGAGAWAPMAVAIVDCDGDGVLDFVLEEPDPPEKLGALVRVACSGRDGAEIWRFEQVVDARLAAGVTSARRSGDFPERAASLGGLRVVDFADAGPTLVTWNARPTSADAGAGARTVEWRFQALDPRGPKVRWEWTTGIRESFHWREYRLQVQPVRRGGRVAGLFVAAPTVDGAAWWIDANGAARELHEPPGDDPDVAPPASFRFSRIVPIDVDGDGDDELFVVADDRATMFGGLPELRRRWTREFSKEVEFLGFEPTREGPPTRAVVHDATAPKCVVGLELRDGSIAWSVPTPHDGAFKEVVLGTPGEGRAPYVAFDEHGDWHGVRQASLGAPRDRDAAPSVDEASRTPRDPRVLDDSWRRLGWGPSPPPVAPSGPDPHLARELPWARDPYRFLGDWQTHYDRPPTPYDLLLAFGLRAFLAAVVCIAPGWYVGRIVRRRQFTLRQLFLAPVVVLLFLAAWRIESRTLESTDWFDSPLVVLEFIGEMIPAAAAEWLAGPVFAALIYAPLVVFLGRLACTAAAERWRVLAGWSAGWLVVGLALAAWLIADDRASRPLATGEYYESPGLRAAWFLAWNALYVLAWLALLAWPFVKAFAWWRGRAASSQNSAAS